MMKALKGYRHPAALIERRVALPLEIALAILGIGSIFQTWNIAPVILLGIWVAVALVYIGFAVHRLWRATQDPDVNRISAISKATHQGTWGTVIQVDVLVIALTSIMGFVAAFPILRGAGDSDYAFWSRTFGVAAILCSWVMLQTGFSRLYADSYFVEGDSSGLDFPNTPEPGLVEFAYFTFSIGATFQTSDTSVTSAHMRWLVTVHGYCNFLYNSILIALAVSVITNL